MKKVGILFLLLLFILSGCRETDSQQNVSSTDVDAQTLYSDFLLKKVSAADKEGNDISFETYLNDNPQSAYRKYAIYDMNGDDTPELIIKTENALDIFWIKNDKVTLWYQGTSYSKPLNNRAILYERPAGAPQHTDYQYIVLDYNGEEMLKVSFSEYYGGGDPLFFEQFGSDEAYLINEQQVTKTVYENLCKTPVLSIADDAIEWQDILLSEKTEFTTSDNNIAKEYYEKILKSEQAFYSDVNEADIVLSDYNKKVWQYSFVDMDADYIDELAIMFEDGSILLIKKDGADVIGFNFGVKGMTQIYADGSFLWNQASANCYGCSKLEFADKTYTTVELWRVENDAPDQTSYYINGKAVTEKEFNTFTKKSTQTSTQWNLW